VIGVPARAELGSSSRLEALRRWRRMTALCRARLETSYVVRIARALGYAVALGYAGLILFLPQGTDHDLDRGLTIAALGWISWSAALAALGTARNQQRRDEDDGIIDLLRLRAYPVGRMELGRGFAAVETVAVTAARPGLALALLALVLSPSLPVVIERVRVCLGVAAFSIVLGAVLGSLARFCATSFRERGRGAFVVCLLAPELLRQAWPTTPSIPALLADAKAVIFGFGAGS
jgi:hypothetical protein